MNIEQTIVSVVMPAFNGEKYISAAIKSGLSQLTENDELIIVDNASTDGTERIVEAIPDPRIKYHYEPKKGADFAVLSENRDRGVLARVPVQSKCHSDPEAHIPGISGAAPAPEQRSPTVP